MLSLLLKDMAMDEKQKKTQRQTLFEHVGVSPSNRQQQPWKTKGLSGAGQLLCCLLPFKECLQKERND